MSNELKLSGCQSALTKALAELADARDKNAALSDQTAVKDAVIRDGIKLWGPVAQTVIGTMWIEAAERAFRYSPSVEKAAAVRRVVVAAENLCPSNGTWADEPSVDYDEVQIDKDALAEFKASLAALAALESKENAAKEEK